MSRRIVITGVGKGLGRALVEEFVRRDCQVAGCSRGEKGIAELQERHGAPHRFRVVDVTDETGVREWASELSAEFGPPDLLINNAAIINQNAPLWKIDGADFDRLMDINVSGVARCIRYFVPAMIAAGTGIVVNLSSGWGRSTSAEVAPYCASKWAIEGLTLALAQELPEGLAAVPLNPGVINTSMLRSCMGTGAASYPEGRGMGAESGGIPVGSRRRRQWKAAYGSMKSIPGSASEGIA